mgnify:CR=1 FL=1
MTARIGRWIGALEGFESRMSGVAMTRHYGRLTKITGLVMEAEGIKMPLGATCFIERVINGNTEEVICEVVGFNGPRMLLMPLAELEGIAPGARVYAQSTGSGGQTCHWVMNCSAVSLMPPVTRWTAKGRWKPKSAPR